MLSTILGDPLDLTLTELTQLTGYVLFIHQHEERLDRNAFQEWMRVVRNLAVNTLIERPQDLRSAALGLRELLPHAPHILTHLAGLTPADRVPGFLPQQVVEEQLKAGLILRDSGWRALLDLAEQHGYFRGQIQFLCDYAGVADEWGRRGNFAWDEAMDSALQASFTNYWKLAEAMFSKSGLRDPGQFRWQRALLSLGDYLLPMGWTNLSFLVDAPTELYSWKRYLRGGLPGSSEETKRQLLHHLWDELVEELPLTEQLDAIIARATGIDAWRMAFLHTPEAFVYCGFHAVQRKSATEIYLLKRKQRNGQHAELFSYCLYQALGEPARQERLLPLERFDYRFQIGQEETPHFALRFTHHGVALEFLVYFTDGNYQTWIEMNDLQPFPRLQKFLVEHADFAPSETWPEWLVRTSAPVEIDGALENLAHLLAGLG